MDENKETKVETTNAEKPKKKKGFKAKLILFLIILIAIGGATCYFVFIPKTIDMSKFIEVSYDGYDGNAVASVKIKKDELKKAIKNEDVAKNFIKKVEFDIDGNKKLSNGDEIEIKINISDSFLKNNKLKLKDDTIKYKVSGLTETSKLDLSKYLKLDLEGYNGYASAKVTLSDELKEIIGKDNFSDMKKAISFEVLNNGELKNDEDAEIEISLSKSWLTEHGIELKSTIVNVEVSGLEEGTVIDAFESMSVEISGMSPNLNLSVSNDSSDEFIKTIVFTPAKTSGITNGETIKITITDYDKDLAEKEGYVLKELSTDYKVDNQASFVSSVSEITDAVKNEVKKLYVSKAKASAEEVHWYGEPQQGDIEVIKHQIRDYTDYRYVNVDAVATDLKVGTPEVVSLYLLTKKDSSSSLDMNKLIGIVKFPYTSTANGITYNWYATVVATNFSLKKDGTISDNAVYSVSVESGKNEEEAYQRWVNSEKDNYNVDKIQLK